MEDRRRSHILRYNIAAVLDTAVQAITVAFDHHEVRLDGSNGDFGH